MSYHHHNEIAGLNIAAVERETGISKDLLRMWERRYGFPQPQRDRFGDRVYPLTQIEKLRLIRRLLDQGMRPGKIVLRSTDELTELLGGIASGLRQPRDDADQLDQLIELLLLHDIPRLQRFLQAQFVNRGLSNFVSDFVVAANRRVAEATLASEISACEAHCFSEQVQSIIRQVIYAFGQSELRPRVLLTTVPEEPHTLDLLMVEALLRAQNCQALPLGTALPLTEIAAAANRYRVDMVALAFGASFAATSILSTLTELRSRLPQGIELWASGAGVAGVRRHLPGVELFGELGQITLAVETWRKRLA
ncbi:MerR family transcriptional regulator [Parachitinimonas caeni]|uniref:MerR family transcriptional regulator n=1 Tax=Parachitinimonas caeni TaxID=3031301 RepID=A0ABT7DSI7_9NEIS|nr:MerR family transcriptional regulator [Parachitinimonas caeni]MDK2123036.1 MerR family transcriptional regulator [Parachitinimonas caeni]